MFNVSREKLTEKQQVLQATMLKGMLDAYYGALPAANEISELFNDNEVLTINFLCSVAIKFNAIILARVINTFLRENMSVDERRQLVKQLFDVGIELTMDAMNSFQQDPKTVQ
jgi:hypothetical protein